MIKKFILASSAICLLSSPFNAVAESAGQKFDEFVNELPKAFKEGTPYLNLRYRYEQVSQDNFSKDARASTLLTKLGFKSGEFFEGMQAHIEVENVSIMASDDDYNSTVNGKTQFPIVADPDVTLLNQLYLQFNYIQDTKIKLGRQLINLDDQRFIGAVPWRQNDQTMDGISIQNNSIENLNLFYAYVNQVNRIFGPDSAAGEFDDANIHLVNGNYKLNEYFNIVGYTYLLDTEDSPANSSATYGGYIKGKAPIEENMHVNYKAEYAYQEDYADNPNSYDVNYYSGEIGINIHGVGLEYQHEVLESDGSAATAFRTPLATLHKFNGWADLFLATPAGGLVDNNVSLSYKVNGVDKLVDGTVMKVIYHDFSAEQSGFADYGDEVDFIIKKKLTKNYSVLGKYANFNADSASGLNDREVFWLQFAANF